MKTDPDMMVLMATPAFRRFLLNIGKASGIWLPTAGAEQSLLYREGQRSLGLEIYRQAARGLSRGSVEQVLAIVLSESTPKETPNDPDQDSESVERR